MDDLELNTLWKEYDRKLEESRVLNLQTWAVNRQTFEWLQAHRAVNHKRRSGPYKLRKGMFKKRNFDDQVIGRTMKPRFVQLIGRPIQPQMRILVMRDQRMDRHFGRDRQRK